MHIVYLSLGTNLGNRKAIMHEAIESPNLFLNACVCVSTSLAPRQLLDATQAIEIEMGRVKKSINAQYTDRIIDIDILLYDNLNINEPNLVIPHPLMEERDFVMLPLKEIWDD